jgi:hypothetical protein
MMRVTDLIVACGLYDTNGRYVKGRTSSITKKIQKEYHLFFYSPPSQFRSMMIQVCLVFQIGDDHLCRHL